MTWSVHFPKADHYSITCTECSGTGENECGGPSADGSIDNVCCLCHGTTVNVLNHTGYSDGTKAGYTIVEASRHLFATEELADAAALYWGPDAVVVDEGP